MTGKDDRLEVEPAPAVTEYIPPLHTRPPAHHDVGVRAAPITAPLRPDDAPDIPSTNGLAAPAALVQVPDALPAVAPGADLSQPALHWRWKALVLLLTLGVYLAFVNQQVRYNSPPTGDQPFYLMVTMSIIQDGDLDLANNFANRDEDKFYGLAPHPEDFVGIPAPYPLPPHNTFANARPVTEQYNFHLPGLSAALIPAWLIGGSFGLWWPATIVFMCFIGALTALNVFLFAYELTGKKWIAFAVWLPISFSNPVMTYSYLIFTELTCGLLLLYAFRRLALGWGANGPVRLTLIGLCIAYMPWVAWRCVSLSVGLFIYAVFQWWRYYRLSRKVAIEQTEARAADVVAVKPKAGSRRRLWELAYVLVPVAALEGLLIWLHMFLYASIFPNNRSPERGDESLFFWPWQGREQITHFATSIYGLLFDRQYGFFIYAPIYILGIAGIVLMYRSARRSDRRLLGWMAVMAAPYLFIIFSFYYWNGLWCPPARFLTTFAPLMAAPLAMTLFAARSWLFRALYALLAVPGFALMWPMLIDPRHMWPGNPVLEWLAGRDPLGNPPLYGPITLDLVNLLPAVDPLDARRLPINSAWVTLVAVAIVTLTIFLSYRWQRAQRSFGYKPMAFAMQGAAWVVSLSLVGGTWYMANFDYVQHKTQLTEVGRWVTGEILPTPRGIAFKDGKVYVSDWDASKLMMFDTVSGASRTLHAANSPPGSPMLHPGDVELGPDGKLYVLNNGPTPADNILVVTPDGEIERRIQLNNKTQIAIGLGFGPGGNMYVSDMTGQRVKVYRPEGGDPLAEYLGERPNGFDNGAGLAVAPDGMIYEAEISFRRVQQLDPQGKYVRSFNLKCAPWFVVASGEWLDVSCPEGGLYSINTRTATIQSVDVDTGNYPRSPTGMTYGPDGTLYLMDGNTLIAYKVQH